MSPEKTSAQYFLLVGDQESGPFSREEIAARLGRGEIDSNALWARVGDTEWKPVSALLPPRPARSDATPATPVEPTPPAPEATAAAVDNTSSTERAGEGEPTDEPPIGKMTVPVICGLIVLVVIVFIGVGTFENPTGRARDYIKKEVVGLKEIVELYATKNDNDEHVVTAKVDVINKLGGIERRFIVLRFLHDGTLKEDLAAAEEEAVKDAYKKLKALANPGQR